MQSRLLQLNTVWRLGWRFMQLRGFWFYLFRSFIIYQYLRGIYFFIFPFWGGAGRTNRDIAPPAFECTIRTPLGRGLKPMPNYQTGSRKSPLSTDYRLDFNFVHSVIPNSALMQRVCRTCARISDVLCQYFNYSHPCLKAFVHNTYHVSRRCHFVA